MGDRYQGGEDYRSPRGFNRPDVNKTIYVGNLRYDTEEKTVHDWFEKYYGPVTHVKIIYDKETGRSKGFCFVTFEDEVDATEALNDSNGRDLDGGTIRVNHARGPPSFPQRRSFDGPPRGRGGYNGGFGGRGDYGGRGGGAAGAGGGGGGYRGGYGGGRGGYHHGGAGGDERGGRGGGEDRGYSDDRERYSPRRSRSPTRGGKHEREFRDEYYDDDEASRGQGPPKRRRRSSRSKSRSSGERSPSYSSRGTSASSGREEAEREKQERERTEKKSASKPPPSGEAVKKEMMRLRKAEEDLLARVRDLEGEVQAGRAARSALEAQLEDAQAAAKAKDEQARRYRQWLGTLLECTTKLAAGRAAAAAADAEVKQRESDLVILNEEVAAFMSKAREERISSRRARREAAAAAAAGGGGEDATGGAAALGGGDSYAEMNGGGGEGAEEHVNDEAQLAEAMQYAVEEEMPNGGDGQEGGWIDKDMGNPREEVAAKFQPGMKFQLS